MTSLRCNPVPRLSKPRYPSKLQTLNQPDLLQNNLPASWLKHPGLIGTASMLLASGLTGCEKPDNQTLSSSQGLTVVAPIFKHGIGTARGRGMMACVAVNATVYLSEDEAWQVIEEELQKLGINLTRKNQAFDNINIPMLTPQEGYEWKEGKYHSHHTEQEIPITIDGTDAEHGIHIEFISSDYIWRFDPENSRFRKSYSGADMAESIRSMIESQYSSPDTTYWGIFYDPMTSRMNNSRFTKDTSKGNYALVTPDEMNSESVEANTAGIADTEKWELERERLMIESRKVSRACLRKQVRDFAEWLKAQGAI